MDESPRILYELDGKYPYINQTLVDETGLDKQVELFREGVEVAVFNRHDLEDGQVRVTFGAKFPEEEQAA